MHTNRPLWITLLLLFTALNLWAVASVGLGPIIDILIIIFPLNDVLLNEFNLHFQ